MSACVAGECVRGNALVRVRGRGGAGARGRGTDVLSVGDPQVRLEFYFAWAGKGRYYFVL